jgi:YggT family protein
MYQVFQVIVRAIDYAIVTAMLGVVALLAVRLVLYLADVNPFSKPALWTARLSDPLLNPLRRWMRMRMIDTKYAPLLLIILVLLGGYFLLSLSQQIFTTLFALLNAVFSKQVKVSIGWFLYAALSLYTLFLMGRILLSWVWSPYQNRLMRFLVKVTDPLLEPLRQWLGPMLRRYQSYGAMDLSMVVVPLLAFVIVLLLQKIVISFFLRGVPLEVTF